MPEVLVAAGAVAVAELTSTLTVQLAPGASTKPLRPIEPAPGAPPDSTPPAQVLATFGAALFSRLPP